MDRAVPGWHSSRKAALVEDPGRRLKRGNIRPSLGGIVEVERVATARRGASGPR
jgi:hypothetical protein